MMLDRTKLAVLLLLSAAPLSGCDSGGGNTPNQTGDLRPTGSVAQPPSQDPPVNPPAGGSGGGASPSGIGSSCVSTTDPDHQCIGVKIVAYTDSSGKASLSESQAATLITGINSIWAACNVAFQIDEYQTIDPTTVGLSYGAASENELTQIRSRFSDNKTFLLAATGPWNTATIAWTEMPGGAPYGSVVDSDYATSNVAVAHEFGHYMGLDHDPSTGNVMYYIVYDTDTNVSSSQCSTVRQTNTQYWQNMLRN
jgi:hypothetical protein